MSSSSTNQYFADQVLTASPERLQLMLLEAALRASRKAAELVAAGHSISAGPELAQAEAIMTELVSGLRKDLAPELVAQVGAVYGFILKSLTEAHLNDDVVKIRDAIRVLELETETWQLVCRRLAGAHATPAPHVSFDSGVPLTGGLTLEA